MVGVDFRGFCGGGGLFRKRKLFDIPGAKPKYQREKYLKTKRTVTITHIVGNRKL